MAKSTILAPPPPPYEPIKLKDALEERYLAYALSTIMGRALPDVRDGLKPVHRRILHAMRELKLDPDGGYKKCARVVGDVIGKFHPHGDQAVYDALVRLAQDFAQRYPLVDGQGNFGNIDGDNAAAYRYTEARLSPTATALLGRHRRGHRRFPRHLRRRGQRAGRPARQFPNLLANGTAGIAVGMATSIPPHNAEELCNARAAPHQASQRHDREAGRVRAGAGLPDRRHHRRAARVDPRGLQDRPRRLPPARQVGEGGHGPRHLPDRRHRDSLPGAEGQAGRAHRRADGREEAAAARRRARRIGRDRAPGARAQEPRRRSRAADGEPVQADRARGALLAQHERAVRRPGPGRAVAARRAEALARAPPGGAGAALAVPPEEDRASPRGARRLSHRLPQPRRGDPHRPLRGRSEGQADRALQAHRGAGRGHPQPALEVAVAARGDRDQGRARQAQQGAARAQVAAQVGRAAVGAHRRRGEGDARGLLQEDRARPPPHARSPTRPPSRSTSSRP